MEESQRKEQEMKVKEKAERKAKMRERFMEGKVREAQEARKHDPQVLELQSRRMIEEMKNREKNSKDYQQMLLSRAKLPAANMKEKILDSLRANQVPFSVSPPPQPKPP